MSGPDGKVAVVTGGGSGIGLAIAFAAGRRRRRGGAVLPTPTVMPPDAAAAPVKADGGEAIGLAVDVTTAAVEGGVAAAVDQLGAPDDPREQRRPAAVRVTLKLDLDIWHRVIDVNLTGAFHRRQVVIPIRSIEVGTGPHRQHLVAERPGRSAADGGLRRRRRHTPDQVAGARVRPASGHHRRHQLSRLAS